MDHKALSPWNHGGGGGFIAKHIELIQYHHFWHTLWKKMIAVEVSYRGYVIATHSMYSTYDKWILRVLSNM
jgi:hypothetical protein